MDKSVKFVCASATRGLVFGGALLCAFLRPAQAQAAHRLLSRHVPSLVATSTLLGDLASGTPMNLAVGLPPRDPQGLDALLRALYDPHNALYRRFLSPQAFADRFGADMADVGVLDSFFRAQGLSVTRVYSNHLLLDVAGTAAQIGKVFHTHVRRYRSPAGREFYAPDTEPSLDSAVPVLHVAGLDNLAVPRHGGVFQKTTRRPFKREPNGALAPPRPSKGSGEDGLYAGYDFRDVYLPCATLTGSGQTLALFEVDAFYQLDINNYVKDTGIPAPTLDIVKLDGFNGRVESQGDETEVALDIEMAASMAPGLSKIVVYEDNPNNFNPDNVLGDIASPPAGVPLSNQASSSWTWTGSDGDPEIPALFKEMAAQGQSYFQAAGDLGAYVTGDPSTTPPDPLIDTADMTAVGGTALTTTGPVNGTAGTYVSETTWNNPSDKNKAGTSNAVSGGGVCTGLAIPYYQSAFINGQNQGSSEYRNIPDVAMVADDIFLCAGDGETYLAGGTSAATPLWAGVLALVNQQDAPTTVGLANPLLYGAATGASAYAADFNDINDGSTNNYVNGPATGLYPAVTGYDLATGLGSPRCGLFTALPAQLTLSPTPFETPTPSFTVSPTFTLSRTPTSTPTETSTRTATPTRSFTRTGTATRTPSPSRTPSVSPTLTPSPSLSPSPTTTGTQTPSSTASPTVTLSPTPSLSPTMTPSWTDSPNVTATATPSASPTASDTETGTATPSASPSFTATPSLSASPTVSDTGTATTTPSASPSVTATPSASASSTVSDTKTATPSASPSFTATPSPSASPTASDTGTATATPSASPSVTATPSVSASSTASATDTATPSASPSFTATPSATVTGTPRPPATPTVTPLTGWLGCPSCPASVLAVPNPAQAQVTVFVRGAGNVPLTLQVFSLTGSLVFSLYLGPPPQGALSVPVNLASLARGVYFIAVRDAQGGRLVGIFKLAVVH